MLLVAVAFTGLVSGFSEDVLAWLGLGAELGWLVQLLTVVLGLLANALLFFAMFRLLAAPDLPKRAMWSGALLGAVGFEILKQISGLLIRADAGQPGVPGVRPRADPARLDQLLLPGHPVRRRVGLDPPAGPRAARGRARGPGAGAAVAVGRRARGRDEHGGRFKKGTFAAGAAIGAAAATAIARVGRGDDS